MTNTELKQFYEKLYFQEVESRDKLHARLQLPLSLILAITGAVVFLFQNFDYQTNTSQTITLSMQLSIHGLMIAVLPISTCAMEQSLGQRLYLLRPLWFFT